MEDKVKPITYLGLDEGVGVHDLDMVGLMHHQSLDVPLYTSSIRSDTQAKNVVHHFISFLIDLLNYENEA